MVLERLRSKVSIDAVGRKIPISPNVLTLLSAVVAWVGVPLVLLYGASPLWFILISGALDAVDGAVARGRGLVSRAGAFLDSFLDRFSDAAYLLYFWGRVDSLAMYIALLGTFAISYARCRGESLGVEVRGVGLMERGERVAYLLVLSLVIDLAPPLVASLFYAYVFLVGLAAAHRGYVVFRKLSLNRR
ncbi:CDP-alcohol phosphatidyltransferase family protein [Pyrobaculum sp.]|uniref:CDP-alcohol phosphatidyltransferase family protein n=1 Tax=Pyrobaculum sp. TaxID=2004705 RepID=UPI00317E691C